VFVGGVTEEAYSWTSCLRPLHSTNNRKSLDEAIDQILLFVDIYSSWRCWSTRSAIIAWYGCHDTPCLTVREVWFVAIKDIRSA
jgi:hypothetical protein